MSPDGDESALSTGLVEALHDALKQLVRFAERAPSTMNEILNCIGDGISVQDREYNIVYQNEAIVKMVGEHLGEPCYRAYQQRDTVCPTCLEKHHPDL